MLGVSAILREIMKPMLSRCMLSWLEEQGKPFEDEVSRFIDFARWDAGGPNTSARCCATAT